MRTEDIREPKVLVGLKIKSMEYLLLQVPPGFWSEKLVKWKRTGYETIGGGEDGKPKKAIKII